MSYRDGANAFYIDKPLVFVNKKSCWECPWRFPKGSDMRTRAHILLNDMAQRGYPAEMQHPCHTRRDQGTIYPLCAGTWAMIPAEFKKQFQVEFVPTVLYTNRPTLW